MQSRLTLALAVPMVNQASHFMKERFVNKKVIISVVLAMSLGASSLSFAQGRGPDNDRGRGNEHRRDFDRRDDHRPDPRGIGPRYEFHRGQRLPAEYRNHSYVVSNWRAHRLSAPPRNYEWVQVGADYALIAIATGLIAQLVLSH